MRLKKDGKFKKVLGLFLAFSIMIPYLTSGVVVKATPGNTAILNNGKLRVGDGSSASVNSNGTLNQPGYYDASSSQWYELTLGNYPVSYAIGAEGDGSSEWNTNGTIVYDTPMTNQVIDTSAYISQSASQGYGTIVSTGDVTVNGKMFEIKNTYSLDSGKSFIKATTKITNKSGSDATNVRFWVGVPDDYIAGSDVNTKIKGNLVNGVFTPIANITDKASTLEVSSSGTAVLFFTNKSNANTVVSSLGIDSLYNQDPEQTPITITSDNSYGIYTRLNDLANNESDDFTWYYAAGDLANIANIANEVNQASEDTATTTPAAVEISINDDTLTAQLKNGDGSDYTTSAAVTYDWYRDGQLVQSGNDKTYSVGDADKGTNITVQVDEYTLESSSIYIPGDSIVTTPSAVVISRNNNTLKAQLKVNDGSNYTTSASVIYDWYRDGESIQSETDTTYAITNDDKGKNIVVKVDEYGLESDPYYIEESVILEQSSLGIAGDKKITGLLSGKLYMVLVNKKFYYVTRDGKLSNNKLNYGELVGTEITGLTNGTTYKVQMINSSSSSSHSKTTQDNANTTSLNDQNTNTNPVNNQNNKTGWVQESDGTWHFVQDSGNKAKGWNLVGGKWYFFNNSGKMETGWYSSQSGDWTYNGQDTQGLWFHLDADGKLTTGWYKDDTGNWYFLCDGSQYGALGVMMTGWKQINGNWYYFNDNGAMASDTTVEGYTLGSDGALTQ